MRDKGGVSFNSSGQSDCKKAYGKLKEILTTAATCVKFDYPKRFMYKDGLRQTIIRILNIRVDGITKGVDNYIERAKKAEKEAEKLANDIDISLRVRASTGLTKEEYDYLVKTGALDPKQYYTDEQMQNEATRYGLERWWTNTKEYWKTRFAAKDTEMMNDDYRKYLESYAIPDNNTYNSRHREALRAANQRYEDAKAYWCTANSALYEKYKNDPIIKEYEKYSDMKVGDKRWNKTAASAEKAATVAGDTATVMATSVLSGGAGWAATGVAAGWTFVRAGGVGGNSLDNSRNNKDWDDRKRAADATANAQAIKLGLQYATFKASGTALGEKVKNKAKDKVLKKMPNTPGQWESYYGNQDFSTPIGRKLEQAADYAGTKVVSSIDSFLNKAIVTTYKGVATGKSAAETGAKVAKDAVNSVIDTAWGTPIDAAVGSLRIDTNKNIDAGKAREIKENVDESAKFSLGDFVGKGVNKVTEFGGRIIKEFNPFSI